MIFLLALLLVLFGVVGWPWSAVVLVVAAVLELVEIRFLLRWSRRLDATIPRTTVEESMVGATAEVVEPCRPRGTVRYAGELWEAESDGAAARGDLVRIDAVDGLRLHVTPQS